MLRKSDYEHILDIIHIAYSAQCREELFRAVFEKLQTVINLSSAAYIPWNPETHDFQFNGHILLNGSPKALLLYLDSYTSLDPYTANGIHLTAMNRAVKITDFMPVSRYAQTPYAREFAPLIPCFYEMNAVLSCQGDLIGGIALHRLPRDRDFSERDREIINLVTPHLARALHRIELLDAIVSLQDIGVIVLGPARETIYMNSEARVALNGASATTIADPALLAESAIFRTASKTYRIRTTPARWDGKWTMVYLEPQPAERDLATKLAVYGLSKREQEVTLFAVRGLSNREIAERLFIAEQTVKDHLHDVFEKVKIHRRSELAAKLFDLDSVIQ